MSSSATSTATGVLANSGFRFVGSYRNDVHFASSDIMPLLVHAISPNPSDIPCLQYEQLGSILRLKSIFSTSFFRVIFIPKAFYHTKQAITTFLYSGIFRSIYRCCKPDFSLCKLRAHAIPAYGRSLKIYRGAEFFAEMPLFLRGLLCLPDQVD